MATESVRQLSIVPMTWENSQFPSRQLFWKLWKLGKGQATQRQLLAFLPPRGRKLTTERLLTRTASLESQL